MYQVFSGNRRSAIRRSQNVTPFLSISSALQSQHTPYEAYPIQSLVYHASYKAAVTLDSTFLFKTASNTPEEVLTAEQLIRYKTNYRVRKLESNNPKNHTGKKLLIYSKNNNRRLTQSRILCRL